MRYFIFICIITLLGQPLFAEELCLITDDSEKTWLPREIPQEPETDKEILALRVVATKALVKQEKLTAMYLGQKESYEIVTVEEAPEVVKEGFYTINNYKIRDGKICADTRPGYVTKPNPENEQFARKLAEKALLGGGKQRPILYEGKMYDVETDGKLVFDVIEREGRSVNFTYRYRKCQ